jgi:hypothetical protein
VYLIGQGLADLGTADGMQPLSSSNAARAIVSLDYAKLLARYSSQHGHLLAEAFWAALPDDELQVNGAACELPYFTLFVQQLGWLECWGRERTFGLHCLMMTCRWVGRLTSWVT